MRVQLITTCIKEPGRMFKLLADAYRDKPVIIPDQPLPLQPAERLLPCDEPGVEGRHDTAAHVAVAIPSAATWLWLDV